MSEIKNRHGCLTAWLVFIIIMNSIIAVSYLMYMLGSRVFVQTLQDQTIRSQMSQSQILQIQMLLNTPIWVFYFLIIIVIFNIVCAITLFMWKKWGFWGFCVNSSVILAINLVYFSRGTVPILISVISSLLLVLILFGVLHIGKDNKGWPQLK